MTSNSDKAPQEKKTDTHEIPYVAPTTPAEHEGATEKQTGDLTGPGAGYDQEPKQVKDKGGVQPS